MRVFRPGDSDFESLRGGNQDADTVNVLEEPEIRAGIKDYSNWPTIPQLYVKGEFIGGSDIMMEMYESGELQTVLTATTH